VLTVVSANRFGSVGYRILNLTGMLSGNIFGEYGGAHPTVPGILTQFSTVPFTWNLMHETGADLVSYGTTNFVTMGTEHQLFLRQKPAPATPFTPAVEPGELYALTSEDGYVAKHLVAVAPNPNSILYNPLRVATPTFPDALVASSTFNNATRVEFFLYTAIPGQAGQYLHFETVNPTGIFQNIAVQAVSDDPVNSGVVAVQYSSSTAAGEWVLIECI
jgi:hypothetical protein